LNARSIGASTTIGGAHGRLSCLGCHETSCCSDGRLERRQGLIPELVQIGTKGADPVRVQLVDAACAGGPVDDQPGVLQHLEVL